MRVDTWSFERDRRGEWRWRRRAPGGKIVGASTEGYKNRLGCVQNARRNGYSEDEWLFYQDRRGEWRWRRRALNHRIVGAATEGYTKKRDCLANARRHGYWGL